MYGELNELYCFYLWFMLRMVSLKRKFGDFLYDSEHNGRYVLTGV